MYGVKKNNRGKAPLVNSLPFTTRVYINNQVLIPANLVKSLNLADTEYANVVIEYDGIEIELRGVKLLRTKRTNSRQFTIPKHVREELGMKPLDEITILKIEPTRIKDIAKYQNK